MLFRSIVLIAALMPFVYYLLAIYCSWDYFRKLREEAPVPSTFTPPVSILKPVRGVDQDAYSSFASFCSLDYPDYEILFAVHEQDDPVVPLIEQLQRDFPERPIRLLTNVPQHGSNRKVNSLRMLAKEARNDVLVICDSDVRVESNYLRDAVSPFAKPNVGAVSTFFRGVPGEGILADLEALVLSAETVPHALLARKLEGNMQFLFGWTMATTKSHLALIGGFEGMADDHSDDFELGNRIAGHGFQIEMMRRPVDMIFPRSTMRTFLRRELRWAIGLRNVRPLGYMGLLFTFGLPWAVLAAVISPWVSLGIAYLLCYLLLRLALVCTAGAWGLNDPVTRTRYWLVPVRDALNFGVWVGSFFTDRIYWRGSKYLVKNGLLIPLLKETP